MPDLYDRVKADPFVIEEIENLRSEKTARGNTFRLNPVHMVRVPDREVLRTKFEDKYGIPDIDQFFIPIITDIATYRQIRGMREPSSGEELHMALNNEYGQLYCLREHVKRANGHFISYISAYMDLDEAIEHEAVHAAMFKQNPHYSKYTLFPRKLRPKPTEVEAWNEAVAYVATEEESINVDRIIEGYVISPKKGEGILSKLWKHNKEMIQDIWKHKKELVQELPQNLATFAKNIPKINPYNMPYKIAHAALITYYLTEYNMRDREAEEEVWKESFDLAARLKEQLGAKDFVIQACKKTKEEMRQLLR